MKKCENCGENHDGSFSTGRFCNRSCANGFSTKGKRKEINRKISAKLKTGITLYSKKCHCGNKFESPDQRLKTCSKECGIILSSSKQRDKNKKSGEDRKKGSGGFREGGGRAKVFEYNSPIAGKIKLNRDEIIIAQSLDSLGIKWERNWRGFDYVTQEGKDRKYYPDFYLKDFNLFLEYKGWVTEEINHKMKDSQERNKFKLKIVYSKKFSHLGLSLEEAKNNPQLILK